MSIAQRTHDLATADRTVSFDEAFDKLLSEASVPRAAAHQTGRVISVVVIATVALIGTLIMGEVWNSTEPLVNETPLDSEATALVEGFGSAMNFVPIVLIVLLAALVIAVVSRMGN